MTPRADRFRWIDQKQVDTWTHRTGYKPPRHLEGGCWPIKHPEMLREATKEEMRTHAACKLCERAMQRRGTQP